MEQLPSKEKVLGSSPRWRAQPVLKCQPRKYRSRSSRGPGCEVLNLATGVRFPLGTHMPSLLCWLRGDLPFKENTARVRFPPAALRRVLGQPAGLITHANAGSNPASATDLAWRNRQRSALLRRWFQVRVLTRERAVPAAAWRCGTQLAEWLVALARQETWRRNSDG
jgi:hypothetical protein